MTTDTTVQHVEAARGLARPKRMYQGAHRDNIYEDEPVTPQEPAATQQDPAATPSKDPELNPEERTYKQRYDALKSHYDKTIVTSRQREAELSDQLRTASRSNITMPKTAEELAAWRNQYPDLYGMLVTIMRTEFKSTEDTLNERISQNEVLAKQGRRDKAEAALERLHPDFPELRMSQAFHDWVKDQPAQIQSWLYENEDDPLLAARAIDLYKSDKGLKAKPEKKPVDLRSAAQAISTTQQVADPEA